VSPSKRYEPVLKGIDCDLSATSLEEAMICIVKHPEPSPTAYVLRVSEAGRLHAGKLLDELNLVNVGRTPFRIHVELETDSTYGPDEWSVHANGHGYGSPGAF
jgi:hypothetical protein